ncbi:DNA-binding protein [Mycobacterium sp. OAE908]|uniref:helix-turn-helix transcriptional regulator n=1 Tax=Mycobacterium sp. OAE908 TaxID=2817899 RepID=UPI001AE87DFF
MAHKKTAELVEQYGISEGTWRWWRYRGEGRRSSRLGRTVFYDDADVAAWIAAQKAKTARGGMLRWRRICAVGIRSSGTES